MQKEPTYTLDIIVRSEAKRKKYFKGLNLMIADARDRGFYDAASILIDKRDAVQQYVDKLVKA